MHLYILDLNGTIVQKRPKGRPAIIRPYCKELLKDLLDLQSQNVCHLAIWTTITEQNAKVIIDQIFTPEQQKKCLFIWFSNNCTPHPHLPFKSFKDLEKAWAKYPEFSAKNTTLFDDSDFKAFKQPDNIYKVKTFVPSDKIDNELLKLKYHIRRQLQIKQQ